MSTELAPLLTALNDVMKDVGYVQKGSVNDFHKYRYASEEDLLTALRPALVKHGILLIPSLDGTVELDQHGNTHLRMAYTLAHVSGAVWPDKIVIPGCGNDKNKNGIGDKGTYKALTGANKYLLFKLCQIATGDDPEVANDQEQGKANAKPPANGNGQKVVPKNTGPDAVRAWADGFIAAVKQCADRKEVQSGVDKVGAKLDVLKSKHRAIYDEVMNAVEYAMQNLPDEAPAPGIAAE